MSNKIYYTGFGSPISVDLSNFFYGNDTEPATEPDKPTCPVTHRVATLDEQRKILGKEPYESFWIENAGRELMVDPSPARPAGLGFLRMLLNGTPVHLDEKGVIASADHSFVQNGCRKSWCSLCDCEGHFDFESGTFKPV